MTKMEKRTKSRKWSVELLAVNYGRYCDQVVDRVVLKRDNFDKVEEFISRNLANDGFAYFEEVHFRRTAPYTWKQIGEPRIWRKEVVGA